jgi:hypothetical protein
MKLNGCPFYLNEVFCKLNAGGLHLNEGRSKLKCEPMKLNRGPAVLHYGASNLKGAERKTEKLENPERRRLTDK